MDLDFSAEDLAFQGEVRGFIAQAFDDDMRAHIAQSKNGHIDKAGQVRWLKRLHEKGWIAPDWPAEYGGANFSTAQKYIYDMEMALTGAPSTANMGLRMILGEVTKPGEYPYSNGLTVLNAVATANGFTYRANTKRVFIKRADSTEEQEFPLTSTVPVAPGDTIRISERFF